MDTKNNINYKMYDYYITIEPDEWKTFCKDLTFSNALGAFNVILNNPKISIISGRFDEVKNLIIIVYDRL